MRDAQDVDVLSAGPAGRALRRSLPVALLVIVADQLTKWWALETLLPGSCSQPDACIDLIAGARLHLVFNNGAAFSRGTGAGPLLGVLALVMAGVLLFLSSRRPDRFGQVLFGAVAGGAIGNLIDRIFRADDGPLSGAVVDFVDLGWWPVFNVADSAIVLGVIGIIAHAFLVGEPEPEAESAAAEPDDGPGGLDRTDDEARVADTDHDGTADTDDADDTDDTGDDDTDAGEPTADRSAVPGDRRAE